MCKLLDSNLWPILEVTLAPRLNSRHTLSIILANYHFIINFSFLLLTLLPVESNSIKDKFRNEKQMAEAILATQKATNCKMNDKNIIKETNYHESYHKIFFASLCYRTLNNLFMSFHKKRNLAVFSGKMTRVSFYNWVLIFQWP